MVEKPAAILAQALHDADVGLGADRHRRHGDFGVVSHGGHEIDQFALASPGNSVT